MAVKPLQHDILNRVIRVQWAGGEYLALYVDGRHGKSGATATPEPIDVSLTCEELGWNDRKIDYGLLVEKSSPPNNDPLVFAVPAFDVPPGLRHAYDFYREGRTLTSTQTFHVLDRGEYGIINRTGGVQINAGSGPGGGVQIPFWIDYSGNGSGAGPDGVVWQPSGSTTWYANLALAKAISVGAGGFDWDVNLLSEIAGHNETGSFNNTTSVSNRIIFINWSKLKGLLRAAGKKQTTIGVRFSVPNLQGGAKTTYYGYGFLAVYARAFGFKDWPTKLSADVTNAAFQELRNVIGGGTVTPPNTRWPPGAPKFFPPNGETTPPIFRFPVDSPTAGAQQQIGTGETKKGPGGFTFTAKMKGSDPAGPGGALNPPDDVITVSAPAFDF